MASATQQAAFMKTKGSVHSVRPGGYPVAMIVAEQDDTAAMACAGCDQSLEALNILDVIVATNILRTLIQEVKIFFPHT